MTQKHAIVTGGLQGIGKAVAQTLHARGDRVTVFDLADHTDARVILHSDGAIYDLIPDLIDAGVQVLNPIQTNAVGMDPERLKSEFGNDLRFWGGIDTQRVLPRGTPDEVAAEVRNRVADLGRGGGYVLASVHNIQAEVPSENIIAMFETARSLST